MKKSLLISLLIILSMKLLAQNYLISFTGTGESSTVSTVEVENLSSGTTLSLKGDDILQLTLITGVNKMETDNFPTMKMYPNPSSDYTILEIFPPKAENATFSIYDIVGRLVARFDRYLDNSLQGFKLTGLNKGFYFINVTSKTFQLSDKLICDHPYRGSIILEEIDIPGISVIEKSDKTDYKGSNNIIEMAYTTGNILKFTGASGLFRTIITDIPSSDKTISFNFASCIDRDNYNYPIVVIGTQTWMAENLKYLPSVVGSDTGSETEAYYYVNGYDGTSVDDAKATINYNTYGVLYNWIAAMNGKTSSDSNPSNVQGVCPDGWHLPSELEWTQLADYLGGEFVAGGKLKEKGTQHWINLNEGATNESGFKALPAGYRWSNGTFGSIGYSSYWWSTTEYYTYYAVTRFVDYSSSHLTSINYNKEFGLSVRCIKD